MILVYLTQKLSTKLVFLTRCTQDLGWTINNTHGFAFKVWNAELVKQSKWINHATFIKIKLLTDIKPYKLCYLVIPQSWDLAVHGIMGYG